ncbi:ATP-dependent zinc metalloprotease FtsH [uncultured Chryseobacterium sp.]|uniref:ATP-dependent zinc metalloprotease FtsH n=1 Tax=uncultured Chryseobacterium sp. TaxID=259322 RepID=UPI00260BFC4F|nr:ATP-dependent zinc metalloprotease FtsH [uncultured Chryseobacterium sp.]
MNNKGFNWFFPIAIVALLLFFASQFFGDSSGKTMSEDDFFKEFQAGKVQDIKIYKDTEKIDVFLTKAAQAATVKKDQTVENPLSVLFNQSATADYTVDYGDLQLFLKKFDDIKAQNPQLTTQKEYGIGKNPMSELLFTALFWIAIMALFYFVLFRRMGGSGGPGGQIFSIGKSRAKLFDEKDKIQVTFKDVAGLEGAKEEVQEVVDFLKNSEKYTKLGGKIPKGVLLVGPPGTGKTLLAKAVAGEAKVPFFSLSGSDFVEMFVGVGASRVRDLFAQAKAKSPAIIFIDEIDAIGRARGGKNFTGGNDERENTLNQLLTEMDGFGTDTNVIVMAATNRADILDKALLRAGRFDRSIYVDLPELHERKEIFDVHLAKIKLDPTVDREFLAKQTPGFSGADIANVCNEAALIAARNNHEAVTKQDFLDAVDRIIGGLEKKNKAIKPSEKKRVAYHEAGHATISWLVEHAAPLLKVTIVPRGRSLGAAWYLPEERQLTTTEQMNDELCATLGGRAAEQVIFGNISTGALSDLERVTKQAQAMVTIYGLNEKVGNISYYDSSGQSEYSFGKPYSEETAKMIDGEIFTIIETQYQRALHILAENKDKLDALAGKLLEKEVIFREDLEEIFGKRAWDPELTEHPVSSNQNKESESPETVLAPESNTQI